MRCLSFLLLVSFLLVGDPTRAQHAALPVAATTAAPPTADEVLKEARRVAAKEGKNVLILFHASWCGWCHKMQRAMEEPAMKPLFEQHFVIRWLTVYESPNKKALENPGAEDLLKKHKGADLGIPYFLVFDAKGALLGDSQRAPGENVGCPAQDNEVAHFIGLLRRTTRLTPAELAAIEDRFKKNKS
ncbi:thioredoxin family protein [Flaviaesturariibacter amylovorans]|uniref:Thioredoxin domain-containing protein n=1 Tax=Flaviaesturariibacter amylovorans TaxID=1084520 RepID=A0ABP8GNQ5_9BACT